MIRFVPAGNGHANILEAVSHDGVGAHQIVKQLNQLKPTTIFMDGTPELWQAVARGERQGDPIEDVFVEAMAKIPGIRAYALQMAVHGWAAKNGAEVRLLGATMPRPRRRDIWALRKMIRREPIAAVVAERAMDEMTHSMISRIPSLQQWMSARGANMVRELAKASQNVNAVAILCYPYGAVVGDLVQSTVQV